MQVSDVAKAKWDKIPGFCFCCSASLPATLFSLSVWNKRIWLIHWNSLKLTSEGTSSSIQIFKLIAKQSDVFWFQCRHNVDTMLDTMPNSGDSVDVFSLWDESLFL